MLSAVGTGRNRKGSEQMILGIYCAGSLGKELYDLAVRVNDVNKRWAKIVFVDDVCKESTFYGTEVHRLSDWPAGSKDIELVIANGTPRSRKVIYDRLMGLSYRLASLIDPTAVISPTASIGAGVIVRGWSTILCDAVLEDNVLIQYYVDIGHDMHVGRHSVISSNVAIGGKTQIGEQTFIGLGAVIRDELSIGSDAIVSMGAVVYRDIADRVIVVGNPARVVRNNEKGVIFK